MHSSMHRTSSKSRYHNRITYYDQRTTPPTHPDKHREIRANADGAWRVSSPFGSGIVQPTSRMTMDVQIPIELLPRLSPSTVLCTADFFFPTTRSALQTAEGERSRRHGRMEGDTVILGELGGRRTLAGSAGSFIGSSMVGTSFSLSDSAAGESKGGPDGGLLFGVLFGG